MFLFKKPPQVYFIQINDEKINKEICAVIVQIEKCIQEFQEILRDEIYSEKEEKSLSIFKLIMELKEKTQSLLTDVTKILNIELEQKDFIQINDKHFLDDKSMQLNKMLKNIDALAAIIESHPNNFEYKAGLMQNVLEDINRIVDALKEVLNDDKALDKIYKALATL
jgi:hypothetical protein